MAVKGILRGSTTEQTADGEVVTEIWRVDELAVPERQMQTAALAAVGIPAYGEVHPYAFSSYVSARNVETVSPDACQITITFAPITGTSGSIPSETSPVVLEIGTALVQTTTELDNADAQMDVSHTYLTGDKAGLTDLQGGTVDIQVPQMVARCSRLEPGSPKAKSLTYTGKVNSITWNGDPPRTWLCMPIVGRTSGLSQPYEVTYEFMYREQTWDALVAYIDPDTGQRPPNLVPTEGLKTFEVYPEIDFTPLNVAF